MVNQLSALGFDAEHMENFFAARWQDKQVLDMENGVYIRLSASAAIACYLSVSRDTHELLDWDAHALTSNRLPCAFDADVRLDEAGQSGLIRVLLRPAQDDLPLTVSAPVLSAWDEREAGSPGLIQPAFCAEALRSVSADTPACLVSSMEDNVCEVCGAVLSAEKQVNPVTDRAFWHITLLCMGNTLDVFGEASLLHAAPAQGTMLHAMCVVTAMVEAGVTE